MWCRLNRVKTISLILVGLMLWQCAGMRVDAQARAIVGPQQLPTDRRAARKTPDQSRFDALLGELKDVVKQGAEKTAPDRGSAIIDKVTELKAKLVSEHEKNQSYFRQVEQTIRTKKLPTEILTRHLEFVQGYDARYQALLAGLQVIESSREKATGLFSKLIGQKMNVDSQEPLEKTLAFLEQNTSQPRHIQLDPHNLPHRSIKADKAITPKLTREEWLKALPEYTVSTGPKSSRASLARAQITPLSSLTSPPTDADLAETLEVKFAPEIRALADSLNRNPVKIFNWVRNNIEFAPTWGSIQGAQLCMDTKSCNAFDSASLLIALLRVSGIPARYQMGTIEVPIDKFMNWAGGFTNADAAASLLASGGIPSVVRRVDQSGRVVSVKLEHVWVRAFVDYSPSAGSVNIRGNTWVEMDASFKQYNFTTPLQDLTAVVPFNRDAYLASATQDSPVAFYRQTLSNYVAQNFPGRTLNDFLNKKTVNGSEAPVLAGNLPYQLLVRGVNFSSVPDNLRPQATFEVASPAASSPGLSYTDFFVQLLDKRISLSFMPASAADVQAATGFEGFLRTPPYLLSLKPVLRLDNAIVASGTPTIMGSEVNTALDLRLADGSRRNVQNEMTAGAYSAILLAPQVMAGQFALRLNRPFGSADDRFGTFNIDNSDRDPWLAGGLMALGDYYFFSLDESIGSLKELFPVGQAKTMFGAIVSANVEVSSLFGAPGSLQVLGTSIDADLLEDVTFSRRGEQGTAVAFEKLRGLDSSYWEHKVFEVTSSNDNKPGISTVRVLQRAASSGVQILKVNVNNLASIESQLQLTEQVKDTVRDAVNAGLEVTIPTTNLQLGTWHGIGYIVEDPITGAAAYQITGGLSGGIIPLEHPGYIGGVPPPNLPGRPSVVIAVGLHPFEDRPNSLTGATELLRMLDYQKLNQWVVAFGLGGEFYASGYNVYISDVYPSNYEQLLNSGADFDANLYYFIGYGLHGRIFLRCGPTDYARCSINPAPGRKFKIALVGASNIGADCITDSSNICVAFTQNPAAQDGLANDLLKDHRGAALAGYWNAREHPSTRYEEEKMFWTLMLSLSPFGFAYPLLGNATFYRGCVLATRVPGYPCAPASAEDPKPGLR